MNAKTKLKRGFTLVELMIVVAIVGVLAALAIYGVRKYVLNAKTAEARNAIGQMAKDASTAYNREGMSADILALGSSTGVINRLCQSATASVPTFVPQGKKYQSSPTEWQGDVANSNNSQIGWACLRFTMQDPQYYQYDYSVTGTTATGSTFSAIAHGDLDGDTNTSTFILNGAIAAEGGERVVVIAPNIREIYEDE